MPASRRRERRTGDDLTVALLVTVLEASACVDDDQISLGSGPPPSSSSTVADDGDHSTAVQLDVGAPLPEGCGDGIIDPAQLCYAKQRLVWADVGVQQFSQKNVTTTDLDEDGRDELLMLAEPVGNGFAELMLIAYDNGKFANHWQMQPGLNSLVYPKADRDLDGDGDPDVSIQAGGAVGIYENEAGVLAPIEWMAWWTYGDWLPLGFSVPFDSDLDGAPDKLVGTILEPGEAKGAWVFERAGDTWQGVEGPIELAGCQGFGPSVYGDFDGDGVDDFAVREAGALCDPYIPDYDPEWWRFYVFLTRPELGSVEYVGSFPAGGTHAEGMYRLDFDGDGNLDLIFNIYRGVSFIRGIGDGTFGAPVVHEAAEGSSYHFTKIAEFDGDGRLDMLVRIDGSYVVAPLEAEPDPARIRVVDEVLSSSDLTIVGDFNGDGLMDLLFEDENSDAKPRDGIVLLSAP